jgi:RNA polymerase sigma-70 factor (ECF subfamily)
LNNAERFRSWLYQIALNQCRDHSRNRYYKYHVLDDSENFGDHEGNNVREVTSEMGADRSNPEWSTEQAQLQDILARALAELPDEQKTVIILKEYQDLTFHDIAEVLKESENTVKSRLYYGLRTLRKILTKWNIDKELLGYEM